MSRSTLVLGGARSGKSAFAERLALGSELEPVYLATAQAFDAEMQARIAAHRSARNSRWITIEEPLALSSTLVENARRSRIVLVDCLTLWLTNVLLAERDIAAERDHLLHTVAKLSGPVIFVSNEVGHGIVPMDALSRRFVDEAGRLHQALAAVLPCVVLMSAGLPLWLKRDGLTREEEPL